ncbi:MAG: phosphoglycerate mutase [Gammaproteobacteria bacterium]|nr:MAG: phosphoglycerate mutase [Gammaproteobacteria bacterium]RLA51534.1 MAG: phosphoglycerate mutase [Gammaproteobacteria bacterium]
MKTLHLLRHAKSSWDQPTFSDRDRGLNKRGVRDAPRMGEALAQRMAPMTIAVSPARRAQLTLHGLCEGWPALGDQVHCTEEDLYTFSCGDLLQWIAGQDDTHRALFVIAHNPALTDLVNTLTRQYSLDNLPTAGYIELALQIDHWRNLLQGCAVVRYSLFPKQLNDH